MKGTAGPSSIAVVAWLGEAVLDNVLERRRNLLWLLLSTAQSHSGGFAGTVVSTGGADDLRRKDPGVAASDMAAVAALPSGMFG